MKKPMKKPASQSNQAAESAPRQKKKAYASPKLKCLGTVNKLTLGGDGLFNDAGGAMSKMLCL